jgi:hypothetical protein
MKERSKNLHSRIESLNIRIETISSLRKLVGLPSNQDIRKRQWDVLETQLKSVEAGLLERLKRGAREYLKQSYDSTSARRLNAMLGEIELELGQAFSFFDTYMDALTQRLTPELGRLLAGCDVLAWDAIKRDHPALTIVEPPLVCCNRGFGASTVREGVTLPGHARNPMPLIEIPYSRLKEKCNLTSVFHEVGHEAMDRLGMVSALPKAVRLAFKKSGAPQAVQELFALWCFEIGPDFWGFCCSGIAATGSIKEIVALPPQYAFRISWTDPHPPPYLRALLSFDWCRQLWGSGVWDDWKDEWMEFYPRAGLPSATEQLINKLRQYIPVIGNVLLHTKFRALNGRRLPDLFDLSSLAPIALQQRIALPRAVDLRRLRPSAQLAIFRLVKDMGNIKEEDIDRMMTKWLLTLADKKRSSGKREETGGFEWTTNLQNPRPLDPVMNWLN